MKFKKMYRDDPSLLYENLIVLGYNVFKIKYYYEVDQLEKISRDISDPSARDFILESYMEASDEATIYLKTINAFLAGDASLPDDRQSFEYILEYFSRKERHLTYAELENTEGFLPWLENKEYSD